MPNDEDEADRLDMLHEMTLQMMDQKLFLAPIGEFTSARHRPWYWDRNLGPRLC